jgi:hypothetical protein
MAASKRRGFLYRNGLSIFAVSFFLIFWAAQALTGWHEHNDELQEKGAAALTFGAYLTSGSFAEVTFENWESEFLQMFLYVLATVKLRQAGSSESKALDRPEDVDAEPKPGPNAPWTVKKGGWVLTLYKRSLSLAFLFLFLASFGLHAWGSYRDYVNDQQLKHEVPKAFMAFLGEPRFWFESFQNWQSEFLAIASIVLLFIWLRQFGSPESKPVDMPHSETP